MLQSALLAVIASAAVITVCHGAEPEDFKPEMIISLERAALDRWGKGDLQGFVELYATDVTYFDPYQKKRIDGLEAMKELLTPLAGKWTIPRYELIDPRVQRHAGVALLTFNLVNYDEAGKITNRWNATEVYCLIKGKWRIVHSHWSYTTPERKQAATE
jgi:ketosteroid isomerase-like protein